jgi:hypothetical protein
MLPKDVFPPVPPPLLPAAPTVAENVWPGVTAYSDKAKPFLPFPPLNPDVCPLPLAGNPPLPPPDPHTNI